MKLLRPFLPALLLLPIAAQELPRPAGPPAGATAAPRPEQDREDVAALMRELEATLEQMSQARVQVENVRKIVDKLDQGVVQATDKERVKTNQFVRQQLAKEFRELRARARAVVAQVNTGVMPKQRGVAMKLKARWELETDEALELKIAKLLSEHEQSMTETGEQVRRLESNVEALGGAIQILENQLSYLELVEESLGLSRQVSVQLRELNQEIDKVVNALAEKEWKQ